MSVAHLRSFGYSAVVTVRMCADMDAARVSLAPTCPTTDTHSATTTGAWGRKEEREERKK